MPIDWEKIRNDYFPALKSYTYIMSASASPMNKKSYEEGLNYLNCMLKYGDIHYEQFEKAGIVVIGISYDSPESHLKFKEKYKMSNL